MHVLCLLPIRLVSAIRFFVDREAHADCIKDSCAVEKGTHPRRRQTKVSFTVGYQWILMGASATMNGILRHLHTVFCVDARGICFNNSDSGSGFTMFRLAS